jgi:hypothetical protein
VGGKERWAPDARSFFQACDTFAEEPLAPLADNLAWGIQACSDLIVVEPGGCVQHDLGSNYIAIR